MPHSSSTFRQRYRGRILQALLLAAVWLAISGKFEPDYLFWGVVSVAAVLWLGNRLRSIPLAENEPPGSSQIIIGRLVLYLGWLVWQVIKSGVYVAYLILHPKLPIRPVIVRFTSKQPNIIASVILGNSITLTPGTLTLSISDNRFTVHALTRDIGEDPTDGLGTRVARLYAKDGDRDATCVDIEMLTAGRAM